MNTFLLDTHTFIWWLTENKKLSMSVIELIKNPNNQIIFSSISAWEIIIKSKLGKLTEIGDPSITIPFHVARNNFTNRPFSIEGALNIYKLPNLHNDPFDRALISEAQILNIPIITNDSLIRGYDVGVVW